MAKNTTLKQAREDGMKKRLLVVEGWDIAVDDDYLNSLHTKMNVVKNNTCISNNDSKDTTNESNIRLIDNNDSHENNLFLRLKGLSNRQIEKSWFHRGCIIYFHLHSQLGNNSRNKTCRVYSLPDSTLGTWFYKKCNISIWLPIVKSLQFENVIKSIPSTKISNIFFKIVMRMLTRRIE